jgi:hypothetical protein
MKVIQYLISIVLIISFVGNFSCKKKNTEPNLTDQQKQAKLLAGSWQVGNIDTRPDQVTDETVIDGLVLTFGIDGENKPTTFNSSGAPDYFTTQGSATWSFSGNSTVTISLTNVTPVTVLTINSEITETSMQISFTRTTVLRTEDLDGDYTLTMTKQ